MRLVLRSLPQTVVMAAIVTSTLFVPVGALLIWLSFAFFGVSLRAVVTFGSLPTYPELGFDGWRNDAGDSEKDNAVKIQVG